MDSGILGVGFEYVFLALLAAGESGPGLAEGWDVLTGVLWRVRFYTSFMGLTFLVFEELIKR